ncbi:MAG: beta-ketoacyl-[acyl-carrier-protein] synthase II [Proteobacteria bacterium]|nr:MAG: beta-ketoacyl-[acyl-carrier-protein] synthase II [Pseudomonadota bacterium]
MSLANWKSQNRRVVVTGIGVVSPLGLTLNETWKAALEGKSGAAPITLFDAKDYTTTFACEVKGFSADAYVSPKEQRKMDRFIHLGIVAAMQAWADAGYKGRAEENGMDPNLLGTVMSAGMGGLPIIEDVVNTIRDKGPKRITPFFIPSVIPNMTSGHVSMMLNARGPNQCAVTACASSTHAIGEAAMMISRGDVDYMIAGGSESVICPTGVGGFAAMKALSTRNADPTKASRPFDRDRDGFVVGEGGAALILEEYEHAKKRGARIYGEVTGYANTADAYHMTSPAPEGEGAGRCMALALKHGQIDPTTIGYVNAHGTSTPAGDENESMAVERVFGDHAKKLIVGSTKSMTGHLLGGAGALEAALSLMAMNTGDIPPTINLDNPSEQCRLNYAAHTAVQKKLTGVMSNSFGFGGTNATVAFAKI